MPNPWDAHEAILNRDMSRVVARPAIDVAAPLLRQLVDYATNVLVRCESSVAGSKDEHAGVFCLYRHVIEMTDGIEVLVRDACPRPGLLLVRSSFEAVLALEYIIEANSEQRSLAWLCGHIHERIDVHERMDPDTERGRLFRVAMRADKYTREVTMGDFSSSEPIARLRALLARQPMLSVEEEYSRCKGRRGKPEWFRLFDGPANLYELCQHLQHVSIYDVLYRKWSSISHATDYEQFAQADTSGTTFVRPLRDPSGVLNDIGEVSVYAANFMLMATRMLLETYRSGEERNFAEWYRDNVRAGFLRVAGREW